MSEGTVARASAAESSRPLSLAGAGSVRVRLLLAPAALALAGTLLAHAGFGERGQLAFAVLSLAALMALLAIDPDSVREALAIPLVGVLVAVALLSALSALWTTGEPADALRWGAVVGGYAIFAIAGIAGARRGGAEAAALFVAAFALLCGVLGLAWAAAQEQPLAERIGGAWRPGGPFEYPPALGALQLAALPILLRSAGEPGRAAGLGAIGAAVAAAVIALVSSRAVLALGALLIVILIAFPQRTVGYARPMALAVAAFALTAGGAADAIAGSYADPYAETSDLPRVVGLTLLAPAMVGLWLATRGCFDVGGRLRSGTRARALAATIVPLALALGAAALTPDGGDAVEPDSGLTHGRVEIWEDAVETARSGPLAGAGALTFADASRLHQEPPYARFAHNLVLEQWVELGVAGLVLGLCLVGLVIAALVRARDTRAQWILGSGAVAYLVALMIDWPWRIPASAAIAAFIFGALWAVSPPRGAEAERVAG